MNVHPQTAAYRALIFCIKNDIRINALSNAAQGGYESDFPLVGVFTDQSPGVLWYGENTDQMEMIIALTPCLMPRKAVKHNYFLYDKPSQTSAGASV